MATTAGGTDTFTHWCDSGTAAVTTDSTWVNWVSGGTDITSGDQITITTSASTEECWVTWVDASGGALVVQTEELTPEQMRESEERMDAIREETRLRVAADAKKREEKKEASDRALELLIGALSERQLDEWERTKRFTVEGKSGAKYRIKKGRQVNIEELHKNGQVKRKLCAHPEMAVPDYDTVLAQKLWLEHREEQFLKVAIVH